MAVLAFPFVVFPRPGVNDAIWLGDAEWPLLLLEIAGAVVAYAAFRDWRGAIVRAGIGVFLFGAAVALALGLLVFGNLSDDRFAPLLFFPPVLALAGLAGIVVAIAAGARHRAQLRLGAFFGVAFAFAYGAWTLVRGANAWLHAPYGFDLMLLIFVLGAGLVILGISPNVKQATPPG